MRPAGRRTHLGEALRWSTDAATDWLAVLGSGLGMAGAALAGAAAGDLRAGLGAALGGLVLSGVATAATARAHAGAMIRALVPAALAATAAALAGGHGWVSDTLVVLLAGIAAVFSGISRAAGEVAVRFILFLVIVAAVAAGTPDRAGLVTLMLAGALWTAVVTFALAAAVRAVARTPRAPGDAPAVRPTRAQLAAHWLRSLGTLAGWQYPLRLVLCLGIAFALRHLGSGHHLTWIALTVVLLAERQIEAVPVRATQRALGTLIGVLIAGLLLADAPPAWALVVGVGLFGAARTLLRVRNYLAYTAAMTPLIIVILDAGGPVETGILVDRVIATLVAAALVIGVNLAVGWLVNRAGRSAAATKPQPSGGAREAS